jgi:hypothetical protein
MPDDPTHDRTTDLDDLAALADGSLPPERRAAVEARVAASPELQAELATQRRALEILIDVQAREGAPAALRARVNAERARRRPLVARRRGLAALGTAVAVAAALAAFFLIPNGVSGGTVIAEAATAQAGPPTAPAPPALTRTLLDAQFAGVRLPNWLQKFGWRPVGARKDRIHGRDVYTVLYAKQGKAVGYSVIDGPPLTPPSSAATTKVEGSPVRTFARDGRIIVTFERGGHTCVVSAVKVPDATLRKLAGWKGQGTVPF